MSQIKNAKLSVPSESIHTSWLIPHFVVLQPKFKVDTIDIFSHPSTLNTPK
jgi:hypothetical protein